MINNKLRQENESLTNELQFKENENKELIKQNNILNDEINILKKICLFKKLEKLELEVSDFEKILNIEEKNNSIKEIILKLKNLLF